MNACHFLRTIALGAVLLPLIGHSQQSYAASGHQNALPAWLVTGEPESAFTANVPINEINIRAFRHFHRLYPDLNGAENWYKSSQGYEVSFLQSNRRNRVYFDQGGAFLYALKYYPGKEIPRRTGESIKKSYPDYRIDVVTEISDGEKTYYAVKIINPSFVKTLFIDDGKMDVIEEL